MHKPLSVAVLALAAACESVPPVKIESEHGLVRASTQEQAERVADALAAAQSVRETLGSTRSELPEVWVVERDLESGAGGICFERRIELIPGASEYHVAHELVHWYVNDSPFVGLPQFVEEGLADFVALELLGLTDARRSENQRIGDLTVMSNGLYTDFPAWFELPDEETRMLTRLGFEVVSRVGLDRIRALAAARAGPWGYLDAAGLEGRVSGSKTPSGARE